MANFVFAILASLFDSFLAFIGAISLLIKDRRMFENTIFVLVSFSAGALLGGAFFHMLEESLRKLSMDLTFLITFIGFSSFFIIERFLHWHHCHEKNCKVHPMNWLVLIGDGIHNFIDGLVIGASFIVSTSFGIATTFLIILHEIPQELGDFAILVYGGFKKTKALMFNFVSQVTCIFGTLLSFLISSPAFISFMIPFAAGGFIYISASDLIPELHKEQNVARSFVSFLFFVIGVLFMYLIHSLMS